MNDKLLEILQDDPLGLLNIPESRESRERTSTENKLIESFEEINQFFEENNREPKIGQNIAEFMLASRLQGIRNNPEKVKLLLPYDFHNLLHCEESKSVTVEDILNDDPLNLLCNQEDANIFNLSHVKKSDRLRPDYISRRTKCKDFESYEMLFQTVHDDLKSGRRRLLEFKEENLNEGKFFVLRGILLFLEKSDNKDNVLEFKSGVRVRRDGRTRIVFDNGTESTMLYRSLYKALLQDGFEVSDIIEQTETLPEIQEDDKQNGFIYVLSSLSTDPRIASIRDLYKIGCCAGAVSDRIKNASKEPTYLMSEVRILLAVRCYNIDIFEFEGAIHDFFSTSNVNFEVLKDGEVHHPKEWYIVPLPIIEEAINLIVNDDIQNYVYNKEMQIIVNHSLDSCQLFHRQTV